MTICYIWKSEQTEPGCHGVSYEVTKDRQPPTPIKPMYHHDQITGEVTNLVYIDSLYSDWELMGEVKGSVVMIYDGTMRAVRMETPTMAGHVMEPSEIAECGWYTRESV